MTADQGSGRVLIASNRGPVSFTRNEDGTLVARRGAGGLVSGLSSVAGQAEVLWVCAALSEADRAAARSAPEGRIDTDLHPDPGAGVPGAGVPGGRADGSAPGAPAAGGGADDGRPGSAVRMLDIPAPTFQRAYNSVANSTLWFVHHMLYDTPNQPSFGLAFRREWESFRAYNAAFATALVQGAGKGRTGGPVRAMIQDYHLPLVPRMLAGQRPDVRIAHFSHTPWAPPDYYRLLPESVGREVLDGILGADHAGFLCERWADAFVACCAEFLGAEVDARTRTVRHRGHVTTVGVHALGVDAGELRDRAAATDVQAHVAALGTATQGRQLIVRIDRTELSKNIVRGLAAYRELLVTHPEWRGRVTHLAFAYPSRHDLPEYREYTARVQRVATEIVDEFGTDDWDPLILQVNDDYPRSLAAYQLADVLLVNPIRDGMNLVAKEGPILAQRGCALVLSTEAGAAAELGPNAVLVNPFDVTQTAEALHQALTMPDAERNRRRAALAEAGAALPPTAWFQAQLDALGQAGTPPPDGTDGARGSDSTDGRRRSFHALRAHIPGRIARRRGRDRDT
ncbi:MAG TPA: trehalose-6-phosphate synthase [Streptosporangiaceae bacterium]|nr:trehalose-6-phosphate synthase [Streptosporangiaceae bacterium]